MVKEFEDKNYWGLILVGSSVLGLASAKKLAAHGMNIIIVHRDLRKHLEEIEESFEEIRQYGVNLHTFNVDAVSRDKRENLVAEITEILGDSGKIRTMVHSISRGNLKSMLGEEPTLKNDDFQLTIDAMAISLYDWTKIIYNARLFAKDARILSFTSEGNTKAWKDYAAVSAAKVALEAITRSIALEFAPKGIRANCIQAGVTVTRSFQMIPGYETLRQHAVKRNPFKRLTTPADIGNSVYLLSKDEASWITGTVIPVNGGEHLK
ncbi:MAG TPA: SDR family oxidoreductase [Salinimicrobium sp.]|nr:SDR family oxidoreductase [Salinimicrobium sp.]